jgi:NADH-quinone oxidoreductase subunit L
MINNSLYKSCLFLTGGSVEKQTGTTDLEKLGGIGSKMPVTFACFFVAALSISGVPPFNGFFSKELVYHAALERGLIFYIAAIAGSFLTAASFLKLGHAAFLGKLSQEHKDVKEASLSMLMPMVLIALTCIVFGVYNYLPINKLIQPVLGVRLEGNNFSGMPANPKLVIITVVVLILALLNHLFGVKSKGSGLRAVDHIHHAPVLSDIYDKAERRFFDPYEAGMKFAKAVARVSWWSDKAIDWIYNRFTVNLSYAVSNQIRKLHNGNFSVYLGWSIAGLILVIVFLTH